MCSEISFSERPKVSSVIQSIWGRIFAACSQDQKNKTDVAVQLRKEAIERLAKTSPHLLEDIGLPRA